MRFHSALLQLPIRFCPDTLAAEVRALPCEAWVPHPQGFAGNDAVPLVTPGGHSSNLVKGAMGPTEHLLRCPYIMALMAELGGVWGRSRLMGLEPGAEVPPHVDIHYYWRTHTRIHIPVITSPAVQFTCGGETAHMAAGECWVFDSFRRHDVQNRGGKRRIHLVIDTVGGEHLTQLIEAAEKGAGAPTAPWMPRLQKDELPELAYERVNIPDVMSPWEIRCHIEDLTQHVLPHPAVESVIKRMSNFLSAWAVAWARFGTDEDGLPTYQELVLSTRRDLAALAGGDRITLTNGRLLYSLFEQVIFNYAVQQSNRTKPTLAGEGSRLAS